MLINTIKRKKNILILSGTNENRFIYELSGRLSLLQNPL